MHAHSRRSLYSIPKNHFRTNIKLIQCCSILFFISWISWVSSPDAHLLWVHTRLHSSLVIIRQGISLTPNSWYNISTVCISTCTCTCMCVCMSNEFDVDCVFALQLEASGWSVNRVLLSSGDWRADWPIRAHEEWCIRSWLYTRDTVGARPDSIVWQTFVESRFAGINRDFATRLLSSTKGTNIRHTHSIFFKLRLLGDDTSSITRTMWCRLHWCVFLEMFCLCLWPDCLGSGHPKHEIDNKQDRHGYKIVQH